MIERIQKKIFFRRPVDYIIKKKKIISIIEKKKTHEHN